MSDLYFDAEHCSLARVSKIIQGKWTMVIIYLLSDGKMRFSQLKKKLPSVTDANLTKDLRLLEHSGVIHREVYPVVPPKVEYSLTEMGRDFLPILYALSDWADRHTSAEQE